MIYEYALDPALLNNWKDIRYFKDSCGIEKGRLISEYPRRWIRMVFDNIRDSEYGDVEKKRMKVALRNIEKYKIFKRPRLSWDDNKGWLDNAIEEHKIRSFHAIIGNCATDETNRILSGDDLNEEMGIWNCDCGSIERRAAIMSQTVAPLLTLSQHIKFIDPYFNPDKPWFRNPLLEMLKMLSHRKNGIALQSVEYHLSNTPNRREMDNFDEDIFKEDVNRHLAPNISNKISLSFIQWDASVMHNRYIVTNVGCLRFGIGLDEDTRSADAHDEIERLNDIKLAEITSKYSGRNAFYTVTGELEDEV